MKMLHQIQGKICKTSKVDALECFTSLPQTAYAITPKRYFEGGDSVHAESWHEKFCVLLKVSTWKQFDSYPFIAAECMKLNGKLNITGSK